LKNSLRANYRSPIAISHRLRRRLTRALPPPWFRVIAIRRTDSGRSTQSC